MGLTRVAATPALLPHSRSASTSRTAPPSTPLGDLWVVNYNGRSVVEYASDAFSGGPQAPERTISSDSSGSLNSPAGCTFDQSGDLWVANDLTNTVVEYAPGRPGQRGAGPIATISSDGSDSLSGPVALAFDQSGDLWVANYDNSTVVEYTQRPRQRVPGPSCHHLGGRLGRAQQPARDGLRPLWRPVGGGQPERQVAGVREERPCQRAESPAVTISADSSGQPQQPGRPCV